MVVFLDRSLCKCSGVQEFRGSGVTSEQARSASELSEPSELSEQLQAVKLILIALEYG